jgi:hypothetical protein
VTETGAVLSFDAEGMHEEFWTWGTHSLTNQLWVTYSTSEWRTQASGASPPTPAPIDRENFATPY